MRVWTVHPRVVWERLQDAGTPHVDPASYRNGYVPWQYEWLASRLKERIPGYGDALPWWAYCQKPDLRWVRHRMPAGEPQVRIELELDPERVITFPAWAWDIVYCGEFLAPTKREHKAWTARMRRAVTDEDMWPLPEPWRSELEASWCHLFGPHLPVRGYGMFADDTSFEAVFEALCIAKVRSVTWFSGSSRWALPLRTPNKISQKMAKANLGTYR